MPKGQVMNERQKATQFKKGQSGNPYGMSKAMAARLKANAEKAIAIQESFIDTIESQIETIRVHHEDDPIIRDKKIMDLLDPNKNTLIKDVIERGMGKVVQEIRAKITRSDDPMRLTDEAIVEELESLEYDDD